MNQAFTIKECLHGYGNEALGAICDQWRLAASSKPNRLKAIEKILTDTLHLRNALSALDPVALRALHLIKRKGAVSAADFAGVPGLYGTRQPVSLLQQLAQMGFVLVCPHDRNGVFSLNQLAKERSNGDAGPVLFVPGSVAELLPAMPHLSVPILPETDPPQALDPLPTDRATLACLEVLRLVEVIEPRVTASGEIHKSDEARVHELRREAGLSREAMGLALMMMRQLGGIETQHKRLITTPKALQWAAKSRGDRARDLFRAYRSSPDLADVKLFFPEIFTALEEHLPLGSLRRTYHRNLVAYILAELLPERWYSVENLVQAVHQMDRNVLFVEERWRGILSHTQDFSPAWQDRTWQTFEKRLFTWMLQSLFADLGVVEFAEQGRLFRMSPLGRYALGLGELPKETEEARHDLLVVQPDFEVIVYLDRCPPLIQRKLDIFCERKRAGLVSTYLLTQESMYRGARAGIAPDEVLRILSDSSSRPVSDNVREQIAAWQRKMETVSVHRDAAVLEVRKGTPLAPLLQRYPGSRPLGERFILLPGPVKNIPLQITYTGGRRACLHQSDGLQFAAPWEKVGLFVRKRLEEVGDVQESPRGDLTLTLTRKKLTHSDDWNLVAAHLESLTAEPLSPRCLVTLRAWGGDLQAAGTQNATILRFEDPDVCEAVLGFSDVAAHVEGRLGLCALVIRKGKLAAVKKALRAHGIPVETTDAIGDPQPPEQWAADWLARRENLNHAVGETAEPSAQFETAAEQTHEPLPTYSPKVVRELLTDAIARRKPALLEYQTAWSSRPTVRRVDPVSLDLASATPTLSGFCHASHAARTFQIARIIGIRILEDETF